MAIEKILLLENEDILRQDLETQLKPRYGLVSVATLAAAQEKLSQETFDLIIAEVKLPDGTGLDLLNLLQSHSVRPLVVIISAFGSVESAVGCLAHGAFACVPKPFSRDHLETVLQKAETHAQLCRVSQHLSRGGVFDSASEQLGRSPALEQVRALIRKVARTQATVLIRGETGVGKELAARSLFEQSSRAAAPFIKVDCAAVPESLLEGRLFGASPAASSGPAGRIEGCFQMAHGGTILLDEVALLSPAIQARLLRILQKQDIEQAGGKPPLPIDVRIIATTNRRLEEKVKQNEFREDLYLALSIVPIAVPSLRERREDIPLLAESFRQRFSRRHGIETLAISPACLTALQRYSWSGNVRELQSVVERAVLLSGTGGVLLPEHFGFPVVNELETSAPSSAEDEQSDSIAAMEKRHIFAVLEKHHGNRTHAAAGLGISIRTLRNKLKEYKGESAEPSSEEETPEQGA